eukprot:8231502-Lingulodinium_polyedra.AAC.1
MQDGAKPADELRYVRERTVAAVHRDCVSRARREQAQQERPERNQATADEMFELTRRPADVECVEELTKDVHK